MIDALAMDSGFPGALGAFAETLRWGEGDSDATPPFADLRPHLDRFHAAADGPWQAACSLWGQVYFNTLLIPATCLLARPWPAEACARRLSAVFHPDTGEPQRFILHGERCGGTSEEMIFARLLDTHLGRVIDALAAQGGLSQRMLGEGVDHTLRWTVAELGPDRAQRLERVAFPGSRLALALSPRRQHGRRFCCLRHQLAGYPKCPGVCPLAKAPRAKS